MSTNPTPSSPLLRRGGGLLLYALCFPLYRLAHLHLRGSPLPLPFLSWPWDCAAAGPSGPARMNSRAARPLRPQRPNLPPPEMRNWTRHSKDGALALEEMRRLDRNIEDEK